MKDYVLTKAQSDLAEKISTHYPMLKNGKDVAMQGMVYGLDLYKKHGRKDNLLTYLSWFGKTAVEVALGIKNEDTDAYKKGSPH